MPNNLPLQEQQIVLTGTNMTHSISSRITALGGKVHYLPLITVHEIEASEDVTMLQHALNSEWLIFTSQNAVQAFSNKLERYKQTKEDCVAKIAVVGEKTAQAMEKLGFTIDFMPSTYSADVFVKEFPNYVGQLKNCLFLKGSLAKATIKEGLPFPVEEWTVYETIQTTDHVSALKNLIEQSKNVTVIFASPSVVEVFAKHIAADIGWNGFKIAAIGHVTETALQNVGATVDVKPEKYTMMAIIDELANGKEL
ncbi:uroporphyrinogen-III synthase [Rummeliibacillus pycnus]|uniref:uroporphyrinogen-III synthase n=1 Tax=Rummeliibacillus pycnus TaxID=101070 RepID=UPI003D2A0933